jgi:hypothetical protein
MDIEIDSKYLQYRPRPNASWQRIAIDSVYQAEGRLEEVAIANLQRAPELLSTFNKAWLEASRVVTQLQYELGHLKADMAALKGEIILTKAPGKLQALGLATEKNPTGSEGIRQAIVDQDPDYRALSGILTDLTYVRDLFEAKRDALENAYESVKKILGSMAPQMLQRNPNLSETVGGAPTRNINPSPLRNDPAEPGNASGTDPFDGFFGKAQF